MYTIPSEYYFRIHHVRPRFKGNIENVLIYLASEISKLQPMCEEDFKTQVNSAIKKFPGNAMLVDKTINNWRTEISALFGFIITSNGISRPGLRASELADDEDLVECFKKFLYFFQYPGGHNKPHETARMIKSGIKFKPCSYILKILRHAESVTGKRCSITKAETTHCIFNDLRCTRDNQDVALVWQRIASNRESGVDYDQTGDVIRYAGDIIDYMETANLLVSYNNTDYYGNKLEAEKILSFISSDDWFSGYDYLMNNLHIDVSEVAALKTDWLEYVNRDISDVDLHTNILAFISNNDEEYDRLKKVSAELLSEKLEDTEGLQTKEIGDIGEGLAYGHECVRVKNGGRCDLLHLIKRIPTQFAVGYDIQSVEFDERKRYIEVKTTVSRKPLSFNKIHLTPNEWNTAATLGERYFVYRLMISKNEKKLFVMSDPVGQYKKDNVQMVPKNGADITFNPKTSGFFEELLEWVS